MSNKASCPACGCYTSSVWDALMGDGDHDACPNCGLSGNAMRELEVASKRGADENLIAKAAQASKRADVAERRVKELESVLTQIHYLIQDREAT